MNTKMYSFFNSSLKKVTEFFAHIDSFFASYIFFGKIGGIMIQVLKEFTKKRMRNKMCKGKDFSAKYGGRGVGNIFASLRKPRYSNAWLLPVSNLIFKILSYSMENENTFCWQHFDMKYCSRLNVNSNRLFVLYSYALRCGYFAQTADITCMLTIDHN